MRSYLKYGAYGIIGIMLLSLPISTPFIKTNQEHSVFNSRWNGCSEFGKLMHHTGNLIPLIPPYTEYNFEDGMLVVIAPDNKYSDSEIEQIKEFLERGNTLLIADDSGITNNIFKKLNLSISISNKPCKDLFYLNNSAFIITPNIDGFDGNILTDMPSSINSKNKGEITTSSISNYIIMDEINYSNGKIIVISDPDIFINGMKEHNNEFWRYLLNNYKGKKIYVDESHYSNYAPYDIGVNYVHRGLSSSSKFIVFLIIVIVLFITRNFNFEYLINIINRKNIDLEKISKEHNIDLDKLNDMINKINQSGTYGRKRIV